MNAMCVVLFYFSGFLLFLFHLLRSITYDEFILITLMFIFLVFAYYIILLFCNFYADGGLNNAV